ncbi:hypothetical protein M0R72_14720 [Candidatus Pacearchaeota archaeon]|jgi:hypothetical protein|nr:hypothetical protein [Candidatus Pacearchaeota archaeon]
MTLDSSLYAIIRWKHNMARRGWPRHEVRPIAGLEDDNRYDVVDRNLPFKEAWAKKTELENPKEE